MSLTMEELETRLLSLEADNNKIRNRGGVENPFENLEYQLALETGNTVSSRIRREPMVIRATNSNSADGNMNWPDAVTSVSVVQAPLPTDWVIGTPITFVLAVLQTGGVDSKVMFWDSDISVEVVNLSANTGLDFSDTNLESVNDLVTILYQNETRQISREISGPTLLTYITDPRLMWRLQWIIQRQGGHGSDTVNASVSFRSAWIEYTAFF